MKHAPIVLIFSLLAGCASVSEVVPLGGDKYMVGSHVRGGLTSWAEVKSMAVKQANEYCALKKMKVEVLSMDTSGVQGLTPQNADVTFKCE